MVSKELEKCVAITGMGAVSALGNDLDKTWEGLLAGRPGVTHIDQISRDKIPVSIAGEVKNYELSEELLPLKEHARYDRFIHFGLTATDEAIKDSGILQSQAYPKHKIGCILGVGMGGFPFIEKNYEVLAAKGPRRIGPFFIPSVIPNMSSGLISIQHGLQGPNFTISSACASSAHAIGICCDYILSGRVDAMISGGTESVLSQLTISGFASMKALTKTTRPPEEASRPFDSERNGFVIGEGAGILILEKVSTAIKRGAKIYGLIMGQGLNSDAHHITAPHPEGLGAYSCMEMAIKEAQLAPEDIDYVNAHGTSTPLGDLAETKAIKNTFGKQAKNLSISSSKSMTGHLLGAAGGLETVITAKSVYHNIITPTINLTNPDPECDLDYTPNKAVEKEINFALNNSFGFGGTNSSLIIGKFKN